MRYTNLPMKILSAVVLVLTPIVIYSADTTVNSNTTWPAGTYTFGTITVTNNSTLTCTGNTILGIGVTINCDTLTVDAGSKISADAQGYSSLTGPGSTISTTSGAGYGGKGGYYGAFGGNSYGSITSPNYLGSGGGANKGGGCIIINCSETVTLNGDITANAEATASGGGSGGSVWITTSTFAGSGRIISNGAVSSASAACGSGGRIAVHFANNTSSCSYNTYGGGITYIASAGTVFLKKTGTNGMVIIDNNKYIGEVTRWLNDWNVTPVGNYTFDTLVIKNKGKVEVPAGETLTVSSIIGDISDTGVLIISGSLALNGSYAITDLLVKCYGTITAPDTLVIGSKCYLYQYNQNQIGISNLLIQNNGTFLSGDNSASQQNIVNVSATNIVIDSGGKIDVNGLGYDAGNGPGVGATTSAGGGYGGGGGSSSLMINNVYGSITQPTDIGSGGMSTSGGGCIRLNATNLTINGSISANGIDGNGCGSGGSIYVIANAISGSGAIYANGGYSSAGYGDGGGGRIAVYYSSNNYTGSILCNGGTAFIVAGAGTIFLKSSSQTNGDLSIINNSVIQPNSYTYLNQSITVDTVYVSKKGRLLVSSGYTLTITKNIVGDADTGVIINKGVLNLPDTITLTNVTLKNDGVINIAGTLYIGANAIFEHNGTGIFNNVIIQNGGMLSHSDNSTEKQYALDLTANTLTIDTGGKIDVVGRGYDAGYGTGSSSGSGAGYGGRGGQWSTAMPGNVYGSITQPTDLGSGSVVSGAGCVKVNVTTLTNNGTINANGADGNGGGSGGSLYIIAGTISGSGTISSRGGYSSVGFGSGGGGRIAVYYDNNGFTGTIICDGNGPAIIPGSAGTIYLKQNSQQYGDLIIDNKGQLANSSTEINGSYQFYNVTMKGKVKVVMNTGAEIKIYGNIYGDTDKSKVGTLTNMGTLAHNDTLSFSYLNVFNDGGIMNVTNGIYIGDSGVLELKSGSTFSVGNINVDNGGILTHTANSTFKQYFLSLNTNYLYVKSGGQINADGKGYSASNGPGYGWTVSGGSFGGKGGNGVSGMSGDTYGSSTMPNDLGSGGGGCPGGGMLYITSLYFINDGQISANGQGYPFNVGGGGSGGSIYVRSANFSGSGQFIAKGGNGYTGAPQSGAGGGGRIAVYYYNNNFTGTHNVNGSSSGYDSGYVGTIYTAFSEFLLPPNQPDIITPSYGGPVSNRRPSFTWVAPTDLEGNKLQFEIQISGDANFGSTITSGSTSESAAGFEYSLDNGGSWNVYPTEGVASNASPAVRVRYTVQKDLEDGNYYWRVRAKDAHGYSIWSATGSLPSVTSEFSLRITGPANNTVTYEDNIVIEGWAYQTVSNKILYNDGDTRDLTLVDNKFSEKVSLAVGANKYTVIVYNKDGAGKSESVSIRRIQLSAKKEMSVSGGVIELEDGDGIAGNNSRVEIESGAIGVKVSIEFKKVSKEQAIYEIKGYEGLLKKRAKICLRYDSGAYRTEEMDRLRIHWWDGLKWQGIATELDKGNEIAISYVNHFSLYSVMVAGEDRARVIEIVPDMITPNNDGINDISSFNVIKEGTFDYEVMIYDVEGRVVRRTEEKGVSKGLLTGWDGRDSSGNVVESGLYICVFKIGDKRYVKTINVAK